MLIRILLFFFCCGSATAQAPLGAWQLIGSASQKEHSLLEGDLRLYIYPQGQAIMQVGKSGRYELIPAVWAMDATDSQLFELQAGDRHFHWNIQFFDPTNLILYDPKDQATINFRSLNASIQIDSKYLEGQWVLAERLGKILDLEHAETPRLALLSDAIFQWSNWPNVETEGHWSFLQEGAFLQLSTEAQPEYYEVLFASKDYLLLRDQMLIYVFQKEGYKQQTPRQIAKKLYGHWQANNPQYPVEDAELIFRKDGSINSVSNLTTSLNRWELTADQHYIQLHPYQKESKEESYLLHLRFLNKHTILLSDQEMTMLFSKKN